MGQEQLPAQFPAFMELFPSPIELGTGTLSISPPPVLQEQMSCVAWFLQTLMEDIRTRQFNDVGLLLGGHGPVSLGFINHCWISTCL